MVVSNRKGAIWTAKDANKNRVVRLMTIVQYRQMTVRYGPSVSGPSAETEPAVSTLRLPERLRYRLRLAGGAAAWVAAAAFLWCIDRLHCAFLDLPVLGLDAQHRPPASRRWYCGPQNQLRLTRQYGISPGRRSLLEAWSKLRLRRFVELSSPAKTT
jgi:hypothetical protein